MTIHSFYDNNCIKCNAFYVPYKADMSCPNCGNIAKGTIDFIELAMESAMFNLNTCKSFMPGGWAIINFGDRVLFEVFVLLQGYEDSSKKVDFTIYSMTELSKINWGKQEYLLEHIYEISNLVYNRIREAHNTSKYDNTN